jgi:two-component system, cell cycle response regulator DivK
MDVLPFPFHCIAKPKRTQPLILAVDDDEDNLLLLSLAVKQLFNCSIIPAIGGKMALSLAHLDQPDLILLDIRLSDLDGLEVTRRLKQHPDTKEIPIIAVTAYAKAEDQKQIIATGCDDYLSKPYMLEDLQAVIQHHLPMATQV